VTEEEWSDLLRQHEQGKLIPFEEIS
jgi:hypothetical protein